MLGWGTAQINRHIRLTLVKDHILITSKITAHLSNESTGSLTTFLWQKVFAWNSIASVSGSQPLTCNKTVPLYPHYQSCTESNSPSWTHFSVTTIPAAGLLKYCLCSPPHSLWFRVAEMWLCMPLMCTTQNSNSHLPATNSSSLNQFCRNKLCVLFVFNAVTEVSMSHWTTNCNPRNNFLTRCEPQSQSVSVLMFNLLLATFSDNCAWKYYFWKWDHVPQLVDRHPLPPPHLVLTTFATESSTPNCIEKETLSTTRGFSYTSWLNFCAGVSLSWW